MVERSERPRVRKPIADVPADDETRVHQTVDRTTVWPTTSQPTTRITTPPLAPPDPPAGPPGRVMRIVAIACVALVAIGLAVFVGLRYSEPTRHDLGGVVTNTPNPKHPPQLDVSLDECKVGREGASVAGTVRNPTDEAATYVIDVHLVDDAGATITSASLRTAVVAAASKAPWSGVLPPVPSSATHATCRLVTVDRYADG
jgi:hypothetical protein